MLLAKCAFCRISEKERKTFIVETPGQVFSSHRNCSDVLRWDVAGITLGLEAWCGVKCRNNRKSFKWLELALIKVCCDISWDADWWTQSLDNQCRISGNQADYDSSTSTVVPDHSNCNNLLLVQQTFYSESLSAPSNKLETLETSPLDDPSNVIVSCPQSDLWPPTPRQHPLKTTGWQKNDFSFISRALKRLA